MKKITLVWLFVGAVTMAADSFSPDIYWMDLSTTEDGIGPAFCTDVHKQCVFHHKTSGLEITSVTTREGTSGASELRNHDQAKNACAKLANWGGHSDWRLPTIAEIEAYGNEFIALFQKYHFKSSGSEYFWTSSQRVPADVSAKGSPTQDPNQYWAEQLSPGKSPSTGSPSRGEFLLRSRHFSHWPELERY